MSKIEWTDFTWNPVRGCTRVSEGCRNCYAERMAARFSRSDMGPAEMTARKEAGDLPPFFGFAERTKAGPRWTGHVALVESKLTEPLYKPSWRGKRVFVNSMSDLFHEALPDEAIDRVFAVMALCPEITFQVVTKRAERMAQWFSRAAFEAVADLAMRYRFTRDFESDYEFDSRDASSELDWPLPNVWLGVSTEDQSTADERIPHLLDTPAAVRFASYEPALGPVDFTQISLYEYVGRPLIERARAEGRSTANYPSPSCWWVDSLDGITCAGEAGNRLDWIIAGGESGPGARPAHPDWFRSVRDQCAEAGTAFFMKQITECGRKVPLEQWPQDLQIREFPAGRE